MGVRFPPGAQTKKADKVRLFGFFLESNQPRTPRWKALGNQKVSETGVGVRRKCSRLSEANAPVPSGGTKKSATEVADLAIPH